MLAQSFFHLDCNSLIPECGFQCDQCVEEIRSVLTELDGVSEVSRGRRGETDGIIVQYNSEAIGVDDLLNTFRTLPSFYKSPFVPSLLDA
jgi:copper chaperone CopZ